MIKETRMKTVYNVNIMNHPHRFFNKSRITGKVSNVPFSSCYKKSKEILYRFSEINNPNGVFVACPIYGKKTPVGLWEVSDIQIGVTGKAKYLEPIEIAVNRELGEELGICVPPEKLNIIVSHPCNPSIFIVNACDTISVSPTLVSKIGINRDPDDNYRKIGVCVIGSKEAGMRLLSDDFFSVRLVEAEPDIIGVIMIPVNLANSYMQKKHN